MGNCRCASGAAPLDAPRGRVSGMTVCGARAAMAAVAVAPGLRLERCRGEVCSSGRLSHVRAVAALRHAAGSAAGAVRVVRRTRTRMTSSPPGGPGGNVIDKPTTLPGQDFQKQSKKRKPPIYKVLLHNDNNNRREYVVKVLLKVVDGMTVDDAVNVMNEAHINGLALVISCAQNDAERYCNGLRSNGLV